MSVVLSTLPPSPPTTTSRKHSSPTQDIEYGRKIGSVKGVNALKDPPGGTPEESPASFPGSGFGSSKSRKKVEFSPWTNIHNAPVFTTASPSNVSVRPLLPSRELSSSASILKTSSQLDLTPQVVEDEPQPQASLVDMLESITQQLSRNEIAESIDAYQTLSSTLKAYSEVPDAQAFKSKLGSLLQHIRRDLGALEKCEYGPAEINLATQTLKVLAILAWNRNFSFMLSNEIQGYILDRAIHVVEEHKVPKGVILHYLHLLSTQDFRHSIVAYSGRVGRLLDALKDLTQFVKGSGIVSERLLVYHRLLEQARSHMKAKPLSWIHELLDGLTCFHKETRTRAIELGTKAVAVFPSSSTVSLALRTVLDMKLEDGKTVGIFACRRLEKMLASRDDGLIVPQIWAIVLSLMKGIDGGIGKWSSLKEWLRIIQRCFNSINSAVRSQANIAWNRYIYVVSPSEGNESLLGMLIKPIAVQMERQGIEREDRSSRATAFSAYCNLLYYSFRPSASHKQYDRVWEEYIVKVMTSSYLETSPAAADRACRIFMAMFWNDNSKSKLWREIRAQENVMMEPEELPTVDCKWIRSNTFSILKIFKLLFQNSSWGSEDRPDQSFVATGWKHFSKALGAACCKEMKPSGETMQALTHTLAFLSEIWRTGPSALNALEDNVKDAFMIRFRFVCMTVLAETGGIPLVERWLAADSAEGHTKTVAIHEPAPIIQFLGTLSSVNEIVIPNQVYCEIIKETLLLPRKSRIPIRLRIRLLRQTADFVLVENSQTVTETAGPHIWQAISSAVQEEIDSSDELVNLKPEIDIVLRDVVRILEIGVTYSPTSTTLWCGLLDSLIRFADQGDARGKANILMIADSLISHFENADYPRLAMEIAELTKYVVSYIKLFFSKKFPKQPRGKLRTNTMVVPLPVFNMLLFLLNFHLEQAYTSLSSESLTSISAIIDATCQCLKSCPSEAFGQCLKALEKSLCLWLQDKQRLLTATCPVGAVKLIAGRKMCSVLVDLLGKSSERDIDLEQLGSLLAAGFQSTHKLTINQMVEMWNSTFGTREQLGYPRALKAALQRLQPFVDLGLPGFGVCAADVDMPDAPTFVDSQDEDAQGRFGFTELGNGGLASTGNHKFLSLSPLKGRAFGSPSPALQVAQTVKQTTPVASCNKPQSRHEDSQVEYIAIESSPLREMDAESQYLTDRQKEVRARRQAEPAIVFPDLRSSPLPRNSPVGLVRNKGLILDLKQTEYFEEDGPATPTLPMLPNEGGDERMGSSPTPQSKQPALRLDDIEVPSSPPSMPGCTGFDGPTELISSRLGVVSNAGPTNLANHQLLPPQAYHGDEDAEFQATGDVSSTPRQQLELHSLDNFRDCDNKDLADAELDQHLGQASLLDSPQKGVGPTVLSTSIVAADGPRRVVVQTSDEDQARLNVENVEDDVVVEGIKISYNNSFNPPTTPSEKEMLSERVHQGSEFRENKNQKENNNDAYYSRENIRRNVEMAEVLAPPQHDAGQTETGKTERFSLENVSNSSGAHLPDLEEAHPTIQNSSPVITRHTPAVSPDSHAESDDVDMLSASQLSQDLDWHMTLEQRAPGKDRSPETKVEPPSRKRKPSVGYLPSPKRKKDTGSPTRGSHLFLTQPSKSPSQTKITEEVFDCIILDITPRQPKAASQLLQSSPKAANIQQGPRKRGRKPKQRSNVLPAQHLSLADSGPSPQSDAVIGVNAIPLKRESPCVEESATAFSLTGQMFPQQAVSTINSGSEGRCALTGDTTGRLPQILGTHGMARNSPVAVTGPSTIADSGKITGEPVEPPRRPNTLNANDVIHSHNPPDIQGADNGQDLVDLAASAYARHHMANPIDGQQQSLEMQANWSEAGMPNGPSTTGALVAEAAAATEDEDLDIIDSLQQVLKRLKSTRMERPALRKVEDLLFEIRTEAQHAVGR